MGLFKITTKTEQTYSGRYFAKGMTSEVLSRDISSASSFNTNSNRALIAEAFMRKYDISLDTANVISRSQLEIIKIG